MSIIIQKYGGSSVATPEKIKAVAARIARTKDAGHSVVVVVSAMGNTTDELLSLAKTITPNPARRELDMLLTVGERISMALLSMSLQDLGYESVSFTGSQSGIITTNDHTNARIIRVTPYRIQTAVDAGKIVIVAGFQGVSENMEITSLGRGGSDTTAVALAAAMSAEYAEICSDVDGVYSTDPRMVTSAMHLESLGYEVMQALSDSGAKVLHAEAVEWARRSGIEVRCVSTHAEGQKFTRITQTDATIRLSAVSLNDSIWTFMSTDCVRDLRVQCVVDTLAQWSVEGIRIQEMNGFWQVMCSVKHVNGAAVLRERLYDLGVQTIHDHFAMITAVGRSLATMKGFLSRIEQAFDNDQIQRNGMLIEPNSIGFLVTKDHASRALQVLHRYIAEPEEGST